MKTAAEYLTEDLLKNENLCMNASDSSARMRLSLLSRRLSDAPHADRGSINLLPNFFEFSWSMATVVQRIASTARRMVEPKLFNFVMILQSPGK